MFCRKCGEEIPDTVSFCPKCGAAVHPDAQGTNTTTATPGNGTVVVEPKLKKIKFKKWMIPVAILLVLAIVASCVLPSFLFQKHCDNASWFADFYWSEKTKSLEETCNNDLDEYFKLVISEEDTDSEDDSKSDDNQENVTFSSKVLEKRSLDPIELSSVEQSFREEVDDLLENVENEDYEDYLDLYGAKGVLGFYDFLKDIRNWYQEYYDDSDYLTKLDNILGIPAGSREECLKLADRYLEDADKLIDSIRADGKELKFEKGYDLTVEARRLGSTVDVKTGKIYLVKTNHGWIILDDDGKMLY